MPVHDIHFAAARLRRCGGRARLDRGDSPVPSAIIIAGLAIIALGVLAWLVSYVGGFMEQAPTQLPGGGGGG
jgi:hypothetical protein